MSRFTVGWTLHRKRLVATFLYRTMHDHQVFLVNRSDITQPGSPTHLHWLDAVMPMPRQTVNGYLLQFTAVDRFCFIHHCAEAATAASTCKQAGGVDVDIDIDIATHLNILTAAPHGM